MKTLVTIFFSLSLFLDFSCKSENVVGIPGTTSKQPEFPHTVGTSWLYNRLYIKDGRVVYDDKIRIEVYSSSNPESDSGQFYCHFIVRRDTSIVSFFYLRGLYTHQLFLVMNQFPYQQTLNIPVQVGDTSAYLELSGSNQIYAFDSLIVVKQVTSTYPTTIPNMISYLRRPFFNSYEIRRHRFSPEEGELKSELRFASRIGIVSESIRDIQINPKREIELRYDLIDYNIVN